MTHCLLINKHFIMAWNLIILDGERMNWSEENGATITHPSFYIKNEKQKKYSHLI